MGAAETDPTPGRPRNQRKLTACVMSRRTHSASGDSGRQSKVKERPLGGRDGKVTEFIGSQSSFSCLPTHKSSQPPYWLRDAPPAPPYWLGRRCSEVMLSLQGPDEGAPEPRAQL